MEPRFDRDRARLVAVKLEWRQEVDVLDCFNLPTGCDRQGRFREALDSHYAGQNRRAVDAVMVEKWLNGGVEPRLDRQAAVDIQAH